MKITYRKNQTHNFAKKFLMKVLYVILSVGLTNVAQAVESYSRFPCRDFSGYRVIDLNKNSYQERFILRSDEDVLFLGPDMPRQKYLSIEGGRHVAILGGNFAPSYSYNPPTSTIGTKNQSGSIWIEGVSINNQESFGTDGIVLNAAGEKAVPATVRNATIVNVQGTQNGKHGDVIQPQGRISELEITNLIGTTTYQGLFLVRQEGISYGGKAESIRLRDVRLEHLPDGDKRCLYLLSVGGQQSVELEIVHLTRQPHISHCSGGSLSSKSPVDVIGTPEYAEPEDVALSSYLTPSPLITGASVSEEAGDVAASATRVARATTYTTGQLVADISYRAASRAACSFSDARGRRG
jgi:hypothetical protein